MKLRVLCIQLCVGMEDIRVSADVEATAAYLSTHMLPALWLEFLISQVCVCRGAWSAGYVHP